MPHLSDVINFREIPAWISAHAQKEKCGMKMHRLGLEIYMLFHPTMYYGCNNLSMLELKLTHVSEGASDI